MRIKLCIFSKDRACQLDLLLRSIAKNAPNLFDIVVIYKATNKFYNNGYEKLFDNIINKDGYRSGGGIRFIKEGNFRQDVERELECNYDFFTFATDDGILYRSLNMRENDILHAMNNPYILTCSLRLGGNITHENYFGGRPVPRIDRYDVCFNSIDNSNVHFIAWDWKKAGHSCFGYPLSVDMHIFKRKRLKEIVNMADFDTPNSLEGNMSSFAYKLPEFVMISPIESVFFCNSVNRTQNDWLNTAGAKYPISIEELNDRYINNYYINLDKMNLNNIFSTHDEREYVYE